MKPGAIHRYSNDLDFERRLYEMIEVLPMLEEAYRRGQMLADGRIAASEMDLGNIIGKALRAAMEASGERPLVGLWSAGVVSAAIEGYADEAGIKAGGSLRSLVTRILYSTTLRDSESFLEALSGVGDSDLINAIESKGFSASSLQLSSPSLGDLFEAASSVDKGFMINSKEYGELVELSKVISSSKNIAVGVVKAYLQLAGSALKLKDLYDLSQHAELDASTLVKLDRKYAPQRDLLNRLLGGVFLATYVAVIEKGSLW